MANESEMSFTGDASKLLREYQRIIATERELATEVRKNNREMTGNLAKLTQEYDKLRKTQKESATVATESTGNQIAKMAMLASAVGAVTAALQKQNDEYKKAAERQLEGTKGLGELAQLARTPAELQNLVNKTYDLRRSGAAGSIDEAARTVFQAASANQMPSLDLVGQLRKANVFQTPEMVFRSVTSMQQAMGRGETGDFRGMLSKGLAAAGPTPGKMEELLEASASAAPTAKLAGFSDEELLAMVGVLTKATGTPGEAATMANAYARSMVDRQMMGRSVTEGLSDIGKSGMSGPQKQAFFGRQEGLKAFEILSENRGEFEKLLGEIRAAEGQDLAGKMVNTAMSNPAIAAVASRRAAEGTKEVAEQSSAIREQAWNTYIAEQRANAERDPFVGSFGHAVVSAKEFAASPFGIAPGLPYEWVAGGDMQRDASGQFYPGRPIPLEERQVQRPADRQYQHRGFVIPQVPEPEDPTLVAQERRIAEVELQALARERQLRGQFGADGRVTPAEEKRIERDRTMQELNTTLRDLQNTLKDLQAKRRIAAGAQLGGPASAPPR